MPQTPQNPRQRAARKQLEGSRRPGIRLFPDILIILVAAAVLVLAISPNFASPAAAPAGEDGIALPSLEIDGDTPVLSELMALNKGAYTASDGNYYDWIEIYNPTGQNYNLEGFMISDNLEKLNKFVFPAVVLSPGEYLIVYASGLGATPDPMEIHLPFKLSSMGETVYLCDAQGNVVDQTAYASLGVDQVCARTGTSTWETQDFYTPGYPNTKEGYAAFRSTRTAPQSPVKINEIMTGNSITMADEDGEYVDWVELYNSASESIALGNYGLSDDPARPKQWVFPDITLEPGEYIIIYLSGKNRIDTQANLHANFRLNSYEATVLFSNPQGQVIEEIVLKEIPTDSSYGRVEGSDQWQQYSHPTPGYPNTEEGFNALQPALYARLDTPVIISEVLNNKQVDSSGEDADDYYGWVELYNRSNEAVPLQGWALSDNPKNRSKWVFPDVTIQPGEYLLVYTSGLGDEGTDLSKKKLHCSFNISTMGEALILVRADGELADMCMVPWMQANMSYGRQSGEVSFKYITAATPGAANQNGYFGYAPQPVFSQVPGLYDGQQSVELSVGGIDGGVIRYTLDATDPTEASPVYAGDPIVFDKTTVVRAAVFAQGYLPSRTATATYLVDEVHTLPVVSLVTHPDNLFSDAKGIWADGPNVNQRKGANYWQEWEVEAQIQMFDEGGATVLNQPVGIRTFGAFSRENAMKNLSVFARSRYGKNSFDYPLFSERSFTQYKSFVLRNGASEWNNSKIRDVVLASLVRDTTDVDTQASQPSVVYINGEYWGVYYITEKLSDHYYAQHYNIPIDTLNRLVGNGNTSSTTQSGSYKEYQELVKYVEEHDLSVQEHFDYVAQRVDTQNIMDYVICEMYIYNTDTGNIKYWMSPDYDGKWRWIFYDVDWAFWPGNEQKDGIAKYLHEKGHGVNQMFNNSIIKGLLQNSTFRQAFIDRFAYHINVTFESERVVQRISTYAAMISPEMERERTKWETGSLSSWEAAVERVKNFARKRPDYVKEHLRSYFSLSDADMARLFP